MRYFTLLFAVMLAVPASAQLRTISYNDKGQQLDGIYAAPAKPLKGNPGVLILPAWMGITDHEKEVATNLAALGYHVFIADIYGITKRPKNTEEAGKLSGQYKTDYQSYQRRIKLALDQLSGQGADPSQLAAIGYCFGGTGVLEIARSQMYVRGVISVHGGLGKDASRSNGTIKTKVLALHGADDPFVKPEDIAAFHKEMRDGKADWEMNYYGNAVHAFTEKGAGTDNSKGAAYNAAADRRSWQAILDFLGELFPAG